MQFYVGRVSLRLRHLLGGSALLPIILALPQTTHENEGTAKEGPAKEGGLGIFFTLRP